MSILLIRFAKFVVMPLVIKVSILNTSSLAAQNLRCQDEVCFASHIEIAGHKLPLLGMSEFRYWGFRLYTAALYGPEHARSSQEILGEVPKALIIHYHRDFQPQDLAAAGDSILRRNPNVDIKQISQELDLISRSYRPVGKGDRYQIGYAPGKGLSLSLNGELLTTIIGFSFSKSYLSIWLSEHSVKRSFTSALLGETHNS